MKDKILFRPSLSMLSLAEAMSMVREVKSIDDILDYVNFGREEKDKSTIEDLTIRLHAYDKRTDWDTYLICDKGKAVVFTNSLIKGIKLA